MGSHLELVPLDVDIFCQGEEGEAGQGVDGFHPVAFEAFEGQEEFAGGQRWMSFETFQTH